MKDNAQLTHADHEPSGTKRRLSILADNINSPANVGSLFRLCDALGIEKLYLCGKTTTPPNSKINKTSRSTEKHVDHEYRSDAEDLVKELKSIGYSIVSLEITSSSIALDSVEFRAEIMDKKPLCLILGSESTGISQTLLTLSDVTTYIPMQGNNSSMNVISAASIACFEIIKTL